MTVVSTALFMRLIHLKQRGQVAEGRYCKNWWICIWIWNLQRIRSLTCRV